MRFFELGERKVQVPSCLLVLNRRALAIQPLAQPQLQFTGGLLSESDRDDLVDAGTGFGQDPHDPSHQLGRLSRARRGLDDERVVESSGDQMTSLCVR